MATHTGFITVSYVLPLVLVPSLAGRGGEVVVDARGRGRHVSGEAFLVFRHFISKSSCEGLSRSLIFINELFLPNVIQLITQNR